MKRLAHDSRSGRPKRRDSVVSITSTCFSNGRRSRTPGTGSSALVRSPPQQDLLGRTLSSSILSKLPPTPRRLSLAQPSSDGSPISTARIKDRNPTPPDGRGSTLGSLRGAPSRMIHTPLTGRAETPLQFHLPMRGEADFFNSYSTCRRIMEKAMVVSSGMREKVNMIAQVEEEQRILLSLKHNYQSHKTSDSSSSFINDPMERIKSADRVARSSNSLFELKDGISGSEYGGGIMTSQHDQHVLHAEVKKKCHKLMKLRAYQRRIILSEGMNLDKNASFSCHAECHSATKISPPQRVDFLAGVQEAYNALEAANTHHDTPQPPPSTFSLSALFATIGKLGQSLEVLVELTDEICVREFFKQRDEVDLFPQVKRLHAHLTQAEECFQVGMRYLLQFEAADRALLENGALEVNTLREQFLIQKELLTAQEQKEKVAEESRNGLQNRLQLLTQRCELWQELLLSGGGRTPEETLPTARLVVASIVNPDRAGSETSEEALSAGNATSPAMSASDSRPRSLHASILTATSTEEVREASSGPPGVSSATAGAGVRGSKFPLPTAEFRRDARGGGSTGSGSRPGSPFEPSSPASAEAVMERRLAAKWGNPHLLKRAAYARGGEGNPPVNPPALEGLSTPREAPSEGPFRSTGAGAEASLLGFRVSFHDRPPFAGRQLSQAGESAPRASLGNKASKTTTRYASTLSMRDLNRRRSLRYRNISLPQAGGVEATMYVRLLALLRSLLRTIPVAAVCSTAEGGDSTGEVNASHSKVMGSNSPERTPRHSFSKEPTLASEELTVEGGRLGEVQLNHPPDERVKVRDSIHKLIKYLSESQMPKKMSEA